MLRGDLAHRALGAVFLAVGSDEQQRRRTGHLPGPHQCPIGCIVGGDIGPHDLHAGEHRCHLRITEHFPFDDMAGNAPVGVEIDQRPLASRTGFGDAT